MKYLLPLLAAFFLFSLFSCKSSPPSSSLVEETEPDSVVNSVPESGAEDADSSLHELIYEPSDSSVDKSVDEPLGEDPPEPQPESGVSAAPELSLPPESPPEVSIGIISGPPEEILVADEPELPEPLPLVSLPPDAPGDSGDTYILESPSEPVIQEIQSEPPAQSPPPRVEPAIPRQEIPPSSPAPRPPSPAPREPPEPPSFLGPAEPAPPPQARQPVPMPVNPLPDLPARSPPEISGEQIVFSRIVRATVGQLIEIPFRGTGWVYLGELGNRRGINYESRRLDLGTLPGSVEGQSFIFRAEAAGTFILKFYKQDFIQDFILNDHVQVIVGDEVWDSGSGRPAYPIDRGRVIAEPRWPLEPDTAAAVIGVIHDTEPVRVTETAPVSAAPAPSVQAAPAVPEVPAAPGVLTAPAVPRPRQTAADDSIVAVTPPRAAAVPAPPALDSPAEYVRQAQQEFDAGRVEPALVILDTMKRSFPSGSDEAWWLYGQLLEANSPSRDIRLALEYYRRLVREYPQSSRASAAQSRIAYLERYYFNIR